MKLLTFMFNSLVFFGLVSGTLHVTGPFFLVSKWWGQNLKTEGLLGITTNFSIYLVLKFQSCMIISRMLCYSWLILRSINFYYYLQFLVLLPRDSRESLSGMRRTFLVFVWVGSLGSHLQISGGGICGFWNFAD